jgi:hypothetical protein
MERRWPNPRRLPAVADFRYEILTTVEGFAELEIDIEPRSNPPSPSPQSLSRRRRRREMSNIFFNM